MKSRVRVGFRDSAQFGAEGQVFLRIMLSNSTPVIAYGAASFCIIDLFFLSQSLVPNMSFLRLSIWAHVRP